MPQASGIREVSWVDVKGGGQITVSGTTAYVGHTLGREATTVIDVADPKNPKVVKTLDCKHQGCHAHKVRIMGDLMLTNYESIDYTGETEAGFTGGLNIFDVSDPLDPKHIHFWETAGDGVHRFTVDDRYAYISPTAEGYEGHICMILDMSNPTRPEEVGRWHWPGQHVAAGEEADVPVKRLRCHHPIRRGDRLYVSYWHAGWAILDITDMSNPKEVCRFSTFPPFPCPTHTCLPFPEKIQGMDIMLVADEDVARPADAGPAFAWVIDITDEENPIPISSYQVEGLGSREPTPVRSGCHQPVEEVRGTEIPFAWFAQGLRVVDFANPHAPREVAYFVPDKPPGCDEVLSNDVYEDDRRLIYLMDRDRGLHILERT